MRNDCPHRGFSASSARLAGRLRDSNPRTRLPNTLRKKHIPATSSWSCPTAVLMASAESCSAGCRTAAPRQGSPADDSLRAQLETGRRTRGPALRRPAGVRDHRVLRLGCPPRETFVWRDDARSKRARSRPPADAGLECSLPDPRLFLPPDASHRQRRSRDYSPHREAGQTNLGGYWRGHSDSYLSDLLG